MTLARKILALAAFTAASNVLLAQNRQNQSAPATDSSAQASPVAPAPKVAAVDSSAQASPIAPNPAPAARIPANVTLHVVLNERIDSESLKNGQTIRAHLSSSVPLSQPSGKGRKSIPAGALALLTVISTVPAGKIIAVGEISLQLVQVASRPVYTEVLTFRGQPGKRDVPDAAPALGTNAGLAKGASLTFHTQSSPLSADVSITEGSQGPGAVTARAPGAKPSGNSDGNQKYPGPNKPAQKLTNPNQK